MMDLKTEYEAFHSYWKESFSFTLWLTILAVFRALGNWGVYETLNHINSTVETMWYSNLP